MYRGWMYRHPKVNEFSTTITEIWLNFKTFLPKINQELLLCPANKIHREKFNSKKNHL